MVAEGMVQQVIYRTTTTGLFYALPIEGVSAEVNSIVQLGITWQNTSEGVFNGHVALVITKPDGTTITPDDVMNQDLEVEAGGYATVLFEAFTLDQYGTYAAQATLTETDEVTILDLQTFSLATVATVAVAGFDISTLLTSIMPLIMLVMVMQMMKPLMKGMA